MFNPCYEHCYLKYGKQYTQECDTVCDYASVCLENKKLKKQKEDRIYQIIKERARQSELTTLARLKAKYEPCTNKLFGYRIFCGMISGVLVDTSLENVRVRVREYYKNDKKYLKYWNRQKELFEDDGEPVIEVYDLSERFNDNVNCIFELTI